MKNVEIKVKLWDVKIIHNLNFHVDSFLHFFFFFLDAAFTLPSRIEETENVG